mmetsp:Transcript_42719/g.123478  ORF Transcript_42719/g.123478 Transcript_42719/m.123478 type:complete len:210 (-) Transcript_42719:138-767(-)
MRVISFAGHGVCHENRDGGGEQAAGPSSRSHSVDHGHEWHQLEGRELAVESLLGRGVEGKCPLVSGDIACHRLGECAVGGLSSGLADRQDVLAPGYPGQVHDFVLCRGVEVEVVGVNGCEGHPAVLRRLLLLRGVQARDTARRLVVAMGGEPGPFLRQGEGGPDHGGAAELAQQLGLAVSRSARWWRRGLWLLAERARSRPHCPVCTRL